MITNYSLDTTVEEILHYADEQQASKRVQHVNCCIDDSSFVELYLMQLEESLIVYSPEAECFIAKMSRDHSELSLICSAHILAVDKLLDALDAEAERLELEVNTEDFISSCF